MAHCNMIWRPAPFSRWEQFVHLLNKQRAGRVSLRDGIAGLKARVRSLLLPGGGRLQPTS